VTFLRTPAARKAAGVLAGAAAAITFFAATAGPPAPTPNPPGTFSFAVLGDAPYYFHEELKFRITLKDIDQHELASVIHIGDIFWKPCSDAMFAKTRAHFDSLRHRVLYTRGDNEWFDCWEPRVGGYVPLERLSALRQVFFTRPSLPLTTQPGFPENARWRHGSVVFATVHMIGSMNGMKSFPTRTPADDAAAAARTAAAISWLRETFADAHTTRATAVVIAFHVNPFDQDYPAYKAAYAPFLAALEAESRAFAKPVLVVHGDHHKYVVDRPLRTAPNLTRMQVPGSPQVGWVRVNVKNGSEFSFEGRVVEGWKYW
jgi:hypothetical protein